MTVLEDEVIIVTIDEDIMSRADKRAELKSKITLLLIEKDMIDFELEDRYTRNYISRKKIE